MIIIYYGTINHFRSFIDLTNFFKFSNNLRNVVSLSPLSVYYARCIMPSTKRYLFSGLLVFMETRDVTCTYVLVYADFFFQL